MSNSSLLLASLDHCSLDPVGCQEFICTGAIYEDRTIYKEVRKIGPATVARFSAGELKSEQRYWRITDVAPESMDGQEAVAKVWEQLVSAAEKVGRIYERPVCDLTGGYDSRALVAAFLAAGVPISTTVTGPDDNLDVIVSKGLAELTNLPHIHLKSEKLITFRQVEETLHFTEGEFNMVEYVRILNVHRHLSETFDISINGSFGGVSRGWRWELLFPRIGAKNKLDASKLASLRYVPKSCDSCIFPQEIKLDFRTHFADAIERINTGLSGLPNTVQMDHANLLMRIRCWQGGIANSTNRLWPCLSPFGLRSVLEAVLQTKFSLRLRSLLIRQMLSQYQPKLAEFPLDRGYPAMPVSVKNLYLFWPVPIYFGKSIASKIVRLIRSGSDLQRDRLPARRYLWNDEEVKEVLHPDRMRLESIIDKVAVADFLERSRNEKFNHDEQWERLLSLELVMRVLEKV